MTEHVRRPALRPIGDIARDLADEARRIREIKAAAARPLGTGEAIVDVAPARGTVERFQPRETVITEAGQIRVRRCGWRGHDAIRRSDAFDVMQAQAARRASARGAVPPRLFTTAQVNAGRAYAQLAERCAAAGVRCTSLEALAQRGSGGGSFMDAVLRDGRRLDRMRAAIGPGLALDARRAAPHADRRQAITLRSLVDMVCLGDLTLSDVLARHGWSRSTRLRADLLDALRAALDRLHEL